MAEMKVLVTNAADGGASTRGMRVTTALSIFSLAVGIAAIVVGGLAFHRTSTNSAVPQQPIQQSPLVRNTLSGSQSAFYFLTFYGSDNTCSKVTALYNPITDPLKIGLVSNPLRLDKSQSQCFQIAYNMSMGVVAGSTRYSSFRLFNSSSDCSGGYQDYIRQLQSTGCYTMPGISSLYYRLTLTNPDVFPLTQPLPSFGHESFDYHPLDGKFYLGNLFNSQISAFNPTVNAMAARPNLQNGKGYPAMETYTLLSPRNDSTTVPGSFGGFYFGPNPGLASLWQTMGLNSAGKETHQTLETAAFSCEPCNSYTCCFQVAKLTLRNFNLEHPAIAFGSHVCNFSVTSRPLPMAEPLPSIFPNRDTPHRC